MEIKKERDGAALTVALSGRLDAATSLELGKSLNESLDGVKELVFDFKDLYYIASAGLRILLQTMKKMDKQQGKMKVRNVQEAVMDVIEMSGFSNLLTIENAEKKELQVTFR